MRPYAPANRCIKVLTGHQVRSRHQFDVSTCSLETPNRVVVLRAGYPCFERQQSRSLKASGSQFQSQIGLKKLREPFDCHMNKGVMSKKLCQNAHSLFAWSGHVFLSTPSFMRREHLMLVIAKMSLSSPLARRVLDHYFEKGAGTESGGVCLDRQKWTIKKEKGTLKDVRTTRCVPKRRELGRRTLKNSKHTTMY